MNEQGNAWRTMAPTTADGVQLFPSRHYRAVRHNALISLGPCAPMGTPEQSWNIRGHSAMANLFPARSHVGGGA